ncbi:MAG: transcriptional regulator [Paenibacillus sp.]|nr:transcriptional regulator [Paenibacillus sp.]
MGRFEQHYEEWLQSNIEMEKSSRRLELLNKGLGHGTVEFLRTIWFPAIGNFNDLYPEWEVRDFNNGYRYLDLAYMPSGSKGGREIQGFGPHARDLDVRRFKDLCRRHCLLSLDGWTFLPIAYPSITDEPKQCQQLVLAFIGKFIASDVSSSLSWLEAETVRLARRLLRPLTPSEVADHLKIGSRQARRILNNLVEMHILDTNSSQKRHRTFKLRLLTPTDV